MAEELTLTTPITRPALAKWLVSSLLLDWSGSRLTVTFLEPATGETLSRSIEGSAALALMSTINTANLTTNSLHRRIINYALNQGWLGAGTLGGTPS